MSLRVCLSHRTLSTHRVYNTAVFTVPRHLSARCRNILKPVASSNQDPNLPQVEDIDVLLPEEDVEVPGTYMDAMNGTTPLGKAIRATCEEIESLNTSELEMLQKASDLLKKLGLKQPLITEATKDTNIGLEDLNQ